MWFKLLMLVHLCAAFPLKCPEPAQWAQRANGHCADPSKYFCLKNDLINGYSENCTRSDFQQPGRKAVLRGGIDADICSKERYQPFPLRFYTNVSTHCLFLKSLCNEEGQVVYDHGDRNTDTTCRCDYRRGYDFMTKPNNPCFCKPTQEECSCFLKTCSNSSNILSPDYICIDKTNLTNLETECRSTTNEKEMSGKRHAIPRNVLSEDKISFPEQWKKPAEIVVAVFLFSTIMVFLVSFKKLLINRCRALVIKDPGPEIWLIEGEPFELRYKLRMKRLHLRFFKDMKYIGETVALKEPVFRKEKVTVGDQGNYFAKVNNFKSNITTVTVCSMFTSIFNSIYCIEGEKIQLECTVYSDDIHVEWFKNNSKRFQNVQIKEDNNVLINRSGKHHVLTIQNAKLCDAGLYTIKAGNVRKQLTVTVEAFFKHPLKDKTIMEGVEVNFECEAKKPYPVAWFKDNNIVLPLSKFKIETLDNTFHKLNIVQTTLADKGKYCIRMKNISSCADLDVKEMPDAVKQMSQHDRNMFLKAAQTGTAARYYIRVMIVGESGVGKTCLLRRLMNENIDDVKSTDGINIEVKKCKINLQTQEWIFTSDDKFSKAVYQNEQFADCGFWDFAGQKEFYATHQTFLSTNAIYLLVVDMSKDFASKTHQDMIEDKFDKVGEYIDFWLDNIHCYSLNDEDDLPNPPVILIGTGIDKIKNEEERCQKTKSLHSLLGVHQKRRHIRKSCFLSNKEPSKYRTEFENLQKFIFELAGHLPKWGDNLPTRWIVLEKEIDMQIAEDKRVIPYEEAKRLAKICSFPISEMESELDSFLKYEHEIGNLIFFDDIKSYIVLQPKWLVDIFKCFVSPFQFQSHFVDMPEWLQLESIGILPNSLIKRLFKKVPGLDSTKHTQFALKIMEKFDIIVKPTTLEGNEEYYMPCMINASGFELVTKSFNVPSKNCSRTAWFCLDFNFLPPSFFNHILVTFVKKYVLCTDKKDRLQLYRGMGIFNLDKSGCQKLIVCLSENSIAVQVWKYNNEEHQVCNANYSNIREYLINTVHLLQRRYKINIHFGCFVKCPEGQYYTKAGKVSFDETCDNYFCPEHGSSHTLEEVRKNWLENGKEENIGQKNNIPVKCHYCEKIPVYRCYECSNVLCDDCYLKHDKLTNTVNHTFQSTNDKLLLNNTFEVSDRIYDMKSLPGGLLVFVVFPRDKLLTYSVSDKQRNEISVGKLPYSIAIVDRNTVVVLLTADYGKVNSIGIVDIRQRQVIQHVDCTLYLPSYLYHVYSTMFYTDDQLYISNLSGITVTDMSGTIDREIELGFRPKDMCYDTKATRIYCIDYSGNKLICIDRDGNTIFTFTDTGLTNVKRLTIDNEGYVLILCLDDSVNDLKVHRICPDGKSSEVIITGKYNGRYRISSICFQEESDEVVIGIEKKVYICKNN